MSRAEDQVGPFRREGSTAQDSHWLDTLDNPISIHAKAHWHCI